MIATAMAGAVNAMNAPFCSRDDEQEEIYRDPDYIKNVATEIATQCGRMAIEDTIDVLKKAIEIGPPAVETTTRPPT